MKLGIFVQANVLLLLLVKASIAPSSFGVTPAVINEELQQEIERVMPFLLWCDGQATGTKSNNVDGRLLCDVGDGASESGFLALVGQFPNKTKIFEAMKNSFAADDRPYRAPSYVGKDKQDSFSRDQTLGFIEATVAGLPYEDGLARIERYYKRNGNLCPEASDNKCKLSPNIQIFFDEILGKDVFFSAITEDPSVAKDLLARQVNEVAGKKIGTGLLHFVDESLEETFDITGVFDEVEKRRIGFERKFLGEPVGEFAQDNKQTMRLFRALNEKEIMLEARYTGLGYAANLVARQIFLKAKIGKLTYGYREAAKILYERAPHNLWFRTVFLVTNNGKDADFESVAQDVTRCIKTWTGPGTEWLWARGNVACLSDIYGHELVALGQFLLGENYRFAPAADSGNEI